MDEMRWPIERTGKDGSRIQIRPVAYGDAPALHRGMLAVAEEQLYIGVEPAGVRDLPAVIQRIRRFLTTPRMTQLVAEIDGQVVGALSLRPGPFGVKDRHWCSLGMWLIPPARGKGAGNALLDAALQVASHDQYEKIILEVFSSNETAIALYQKFGFTTEGRQENLFVLPGIGYVDNILMARDVD